MSSLSGHDPKVNLIDFSNQNSNIITDGTSIVILPSDHWNGYSCIMNSFWVDRALTSNQKVILGTILTYGNYPGEAAKPISMSFLRKLTGFSLKTIVDALKVLKELGHILEVIAPGPGNCRCVKVISPYLLKNQGIKLTNKINMSKKATSCVLKNSIEVSKNNTGSVLKNSPYISKEEKEEKKIKNTHTRPLGRLEEDNENCLVEKKPIYNENHESTEFCSAKAEPCVSNDFKSKKREKRKPDEREVHRETTSYLNEKTGRKYKPNTIGTIRLINARLAEGYTLEDLKKVIDVTFEMWRYRPEMQVYWRPETLFSSSKFEGYLNSGTTLPTRPIEIETSEQPTEETEQVEQLSEQEIAQREEVIRKQKEAELADLKEKEKAWEVFAKRFGRKQRETGIEQVPY